EVVVAGNVGKVVRFFVGTEGALAQRSEHSGRRGESGRAERGAGRGQYRRLQKPPAILVDGLRGDVRFTQIGGTTDADEHGDDLPRCAERSAYACGNRDAPHKRGRRTLPVVTSNRPLTPRLYCAAPAQAGAAEEHREARGSPLMPGSLAAFQRRCRAPAYPTHTRALRNIRSQGPSSPQPAGCQECCTVRNTRSGCGMNDRKRPSRLLMPVMPTGEPLGL